MHHYHLGEERWLLAYLSSCERGNWVTFIVSTIRTQPVSWFSQAAAKLMYCSISGGKKTPKIEWISLLRFFPFNGDFYPYSLKHFLRIVSGGTFFCLTDLLLEVARRFYWWCYSFYHSDVTLIANISWSGKAHWEESSLLLFSFPWG